MDELDELPTWAARTHVPGTNLLAEEESPRPPKRRRLRTVLLILLGLVAIAAITTAGFFFADSVTTDAGDVADDDPATADGGAGNATTDVTTDDDTADATEAGGGGDDGAAAEAEESTDATTTDTDTDEGSDADEGSEEGVTALRGGEVVDNSDGSIRYAVLKGGQLFLRGRVHSEEFGAAIEEVATAVIGPGNVINEYEIDPSTPDVVDAPIYVEDVILFGFNSIEVAPPFLPILDLGTALMQQNPSVTITVISRTDSVGSDEVNLQVAQLRGEAIVNYWQRQGIDPSRITVIPKGEEEASDNEADAALDRRAEFVIQNLFG